MSDLFESLKQGAGQVLSEIDQKGQIRSALQGIRSQLSEMERRRRVSSLGSEIKGLQDEMRRLTEALGLQTLSLFDTGKITNPELSRLCERINEVRSQVDQKKAELTQLQAQAQAQAQIKCPQCQTLVAAGAEFCPKCGARLSEQAPAVTAPAVSAPMSQPTSQTQTVVRLRCPKCKTILPSEAGFCPTCGVKIKQPQAESSAKQFCSSCGAEVSPNARFCPVCGHVI